MHAPWKRGKHAAVLAGLGFLGVLGAAVAFRADLETWYHFERLRRDPAHLLAIAGEAPGTPEHTALERHVARDEGKEALLRAFVSQLEGMVEKSSLPRGARAVGVVFQGRSPVLFLDRKPVVFSDGLLYIDRQSVLTVDAHEYYARGTGHRTYEGLLRLLPALSEGKRTLPEEPETTYEVTRTKDGVLTVVRTHPPQ